MQEFYKLDFQDLKDDIKNYIKTNCTILQDYNYEGSAIFELLNVLAYITQYQAFYLNMVANELFLDTAQIEKNIYKLSSMLGYVPKRYTAPKIMAKFVNTDTSTVSLKQYTEFSFGGVTLTLLADTEVPPESYKENYLYEGNMVFATISVPALDLNGNYVTTSTINNIINTGNLTKYFNYSLDDYEKVSNDYLHVFSCSSTTGQFEEWLQSNTENPVKGGKYYHLQYLDGLVLSFDNGNIFEAPPATLYAYYLKTNGPTYNNLTGTIEFKTAPSSPYISVTFSSELENYLYAGSDKESLESIKNNAPLFYVTNNRAVTEQDYNILVQRYPSYSMFKDISLWSGHKEYIGDKYYLLYPVTTGIEDAGYVYISGLKPIDLALNDDEDFKYKYKYLTYNDKTDLAEFLNKYKMMSIFFKYLDPNIVYFVPKISFKFASGFTDPSTVYDKINQHIYDNYNGFDIGLNKSNITKYIDALEEVEYLDWDYTTFAKILNSASTFSRHDVDYKEHKIIRLGDSVVPGKIHSVLIPRIDVGSTDVGIYSGLKIYSGNNSGIIIDNNSEITKLNSTDYRLSVSLYASSTFSDGDVCCIKTSNGITVCTFATISEEPKRIYDVFVSSTYGEIMANTVTLGYINYEMGSMTISTNNYDVLRDEYTSYAISFEYESRITKKFEKETYCSPFPLESVIL